MGLLDADVSGNPFEIIGAQGLAQDLRSVLRAENQLNDTVLPSQRQEGIVRASAGWIVGQSEERFDCRSDLCHFMLVQECLEHDETIAAKIRRTKRFTEMRN